MSDPVLGVVLAALYQLGRVEVKRECRDGQHAGLFSFGCTPGSLKCDACGKFVSLPVRDEGDDYQGADRD